MNLEYKNIEINILSSVGFCKRNCNIIIRGLETLMINMLNYGSYFYTIFFCRQKKDKNITML